MKTSLNTNKEPLYCFRGQSMRGIFINDTVERALLDVLKPIHSFPISSVLGNAGVEIQVHELTSTFFRLLSLPIAFVACYF